MKTFNDLEFKTHGSGMGGLSAKLFFKNGFGVSVIFGTMWYSNGKDTYELAVLKGNETNFSITYNTPITDDICGYQTKDEITELMKQVQELKP